MVLDQRVHHHTRSFHTVQSNRNILETPRFDRLGPMSSTARTQLQFATQRDWRSAFPVPHRECVESERSPVLLAYDVHKNATEGVSAGLYKKTLTFDDFVGSRRW